MTAPHDLYGDLWPRYDDQLFEDSVALFAQRFKANGFPLDWFKDKHCLDAGCGGGRYSLAMSRLGAHVTGIDISEASIADARRRCGEMPGIKFQVGTILEMPFEDGQFDFACCSGVLHHTASPSVGLSELARVLRPGGIVYLLVYGIGGVRWELIRRLRPIAHLAGYGYMDHCMKEVGLPANKQRTFLDDLFVPILGFFEWETLRSMLEANGFEHIQRWEQAKLDHEASVESQSAEIEQLRKVFQKAAISEAEAIFYGGIGFLEKVVMDFQNGAIGPVERDHLIFGEGNHRVIAYKGLDA